METFNERLKPAACVAMCWSVIGRSTNRSLTDAAIGRPVAWLLNSLANAPRRTGHLGHARTGGAAGRACSSYPIRVPENSAANSSANGAESKTPEQVITFAVIVSVREADHPNAALIVKGVHRI